MIRIFILRYELLIVCHLRFNYFIASNFSLAQNLSEGVSFKLLVTDSSYWKKDIGSGLVLQIFIKWRVTIEILGKDFSLHSLLICNLICCEKMQFSNRQNIDHALALSLQDLTKLLFIFIKLLSYIVSKLLFQTIR